MSAADANIPAILLRYQVEAINLFNANSLFVEEKSRRTGLTYGFAANAVVKASPRVRPTNTYYIGYNRDMAREFIAYCGDFAKAFNEAASEPDEFLFDDGSEEGILALRINFPSGKSIVALSSRPRSLRGMQGDVIIDEGAYHDDLEAVLTAALALVMWGGRVAVISTHAGADNDFNTLIEDIRSGKREGVVHRTTLKDALEQGLYKRICLVTGKKWSPEAEAEWERKLRATYGESAAEELDVIPARGSGTYLPRATIEACMTPDYPVVRLTLEDGFERRDRQWRETYIADWLHDIVRPLIDKLFDPNRRSFFGQDFARSSDLSTIACGQIDPAAILHNRLGIELRNVPFREQKMILDYLCRHLPMWTAGKMDARGNGQQLAEDMQSDWGFDRIEAVMATQQIYLARMPRMKARFDDGTILVPRSDGVVDDLRLIKMVKGVPMIVDRTDDKADGAKGKRHGDYAIALMNLVCAADEDIQPIDLHTVDSRRVTASDFAVTTTGFGTIVRHDNFGARGGW
ncbi:hypothetical protein LZK98_08315 [Sphingomonas cannabina]|uniref:hypothetical protein n=1 Tax=Sphingomonas cannabina TaxID=2899123 RepID=UPI001F325C6F|nr:hypothetical protein [Sphingomonas cannabina]UIJ46933.1 hypothetical protein LZK98_08315 [Sphingomonas cannabina]